MGMISKTYFILLIFSLWVPLTGFSQTITNVGTDFWIGFPSNIGPNNLVTLQLFISSEFLANGTVYSAFPGVTQNFTVTPGIVTQLTLPSDVSLQGGVEDKGIRITADNPISVYGLNKQQYTTDAFLAIPVAALGLDYRVISYSNYDVSSGSCFSIVATQDATALTIFNHQTNSTTYVNLNSGQTYHVTSTNVGDDLTGSRIQSNFPVAVFGAVTCALIPLGCYACDHIVEQMFPYYSWGKNFVTVPLAGRDASGDIFRIVAAEDGTDISINGIFILTINTGAFYETNLTGYNSITTSKATILAQFAKGQMCSGNITGDPFMMLIPPREQFLTDYTICSVAGFTSHWVNVVAPDYAISNIYQDGVLIPPGAFTPIGTTNYFGAQRPVTAGSHNFNSTSPFGVFAYGWTAIDSYGYPGGCSLSPVGMVNSVTISPPTATGTLDVSTLCFTAHVEDYLLNPVAGVLVTFNISGISNITGNAYTDASGNAQYCYARTGTTTGTDNIYAECFGYISTTSTANWILNCLNPTGAGTIGSSQSGCGSFTPSPITSITLPSGQSGTLEYKWQQSTTSAVAGFTDIASSNSADYSPALITQTTWYRRVAKVDCKSDWTGAAMTDALEITVNTPVVPNVAITSDFLQVCAGEAVTFTATTVNEGTSPAYQWKVNGANAGINTPVFSYIPLNGDQVTCVLTSDIVCISNNPATSNTITMVVNPNLPVSVTVSSSANPVCSGTPVTFSALPVNGGSTPVFHWNLNGFIVGTNNAVFTYTPANGDIVTCILISSESCPTGNPATSNTFTMVVNPNLPVSVSISASANPFCSGSIITFTATPVNGGPSPAYQWKLNDANVGTNSPVFICNPVSGDQVTCLLTSDALCAAGNPAQSNMIVLNALPASAVTFTACFDTITTVNAKPFKLKGGLPLGGIYSGPGVNSTTGVFTPSAAGAGTHTINYSYTNSSLCSGSKQLSIVNYQLSIINCGSPLTDIRDGKTYPTVQLGAQCWMAANLNYGSAVSSAQVQYDNCVTEKYCYHDLAGNCTNFGGLYQWDEMMKYDDTPAGQGLCPPGWHVPTESDWTILFSFYQGNAFAGKPLQDTIISGFRALTGGVYYLNSIWSFNGFATLFWSSTPWNTTKGISHGMNIYDFSVSHYPSSRANAFPVRCLRD